MTAALSLVLVAAAAAALCGLVRRWALRTRMLDVPNARSSHSAPTPRGGGLAIVVVAGAALAALTAAGRLPGQLALALLAALPVAAVGWVDDRRGVHPAIRAVVHLLSAAWAVWSLGGMPTLAVGASAVPLGAAGSLIAVVTVVWLTNLYNFMDGIDGLAGGEAVLVATAAALLLGTSDAAVATTAAVLAAASLGFLVWNAPPARIFMGDVGSGTLGFVFGVLAVATEVRGTMPLLLWLLLLGVFAVDATVTLLRRVARGERWYAAHRSHAYQRLTQSGWSHRAVTAVALLLTAVLALATAAAMRRPAAAGAAVAGGLLLVVLAYAAVERVRPMSPAHEVNAGRRRA